MFNANLAIISGVQTEKPADVISIDGGVTVLQTCNNPTNSRSKSQALTRCEAHGVASVLGLRDSTGSRNGPWARDMKRCDAETELCLFAFGAAEFLAELTQTDRRVIIGESDEMIRRRTGYGESLVYARAIECKHLVSEIMWEVKTLVQSAGFYADSRRISYSMLGLRTTLEQLKRRVASVGVAA